MINSFKMEVECGLEYLDPETAEFILCEFDGLVDVEPRPGIGADLGDWTCPNCGGSHTVEGLLDMTDAEWERL